MKNKIFTRDKLFIILIFLLLTVSFSLNPFQIENNNYRQFDRGDESNIISRLLMSRNEGLLSKGGLTGSYLHYNYELEAGEEIPHVLTLLPDSDITRFSEVPMGAITAQRYDDFLRDRNTYGGVWNSYKTQPGGQAFIYGLLDNILPLNSSAKLIVFRLITILLSVLVLVLFTKWVLNNYGFIPALITFVLIFISPWFFRFAYNLWWALWSYYIPFITMLFVLDKRRREHKYELDSKIYGLLILTVFLKFFFTGAEFITSTLVMSVCPIIFHLFITRSELKSGIYSFLKSSLACVLGVLAGMCLLLVQIRLADGSWVAGVEHIIYSFVKRSPLAEGTDLNDSGFYAVSVWDVIKMYFQGEVLYTPVFPSFKVSFGFLFLVISVLSLAVYFLSVKREGEVFQRNRALVLTLTISILGPLSWIIIFAQHAFTHFMIDYIVWYMPYLLYGYCTVGVFVKLVKDTYFTKSKKFLVEEN